MKRKTWNSDENRQLYKDYYHNQAGGRVMPIFIRQHYQRGHGLAQTIGGLLKCFIMPIVTPAAKRIDKQILGNVAKTGMEVVGDIMGRRNIKETLKDRGLTGIKRTVIEIVHQSTPEQQHPQKKKKEATDDKKTDTAETTPSAERW